MAATQAQVDTYITNIRTAITDYGQDLAIKQKIGRNDIYCDRINLMLLSAFLDCLSDYFLQDDGTGAGFYESNNFFTTDEIRDIMQHINNICKTNYMLVELL